MSSHSPMIPVIPVIPVIPTHSLVDLQDHRWTLIDSSYVSTIRLSGGMPRAGALPPAFYIALWRCEKYNKNTLFLSNAMCVKHGRKAS